MSKCAMSVYQKQNDGFTYRRVFCMSINTNYNNYSVTDISYQAAQSYLR